MRRGVKRWRLENFEKLDELGRGRFGVVYSAVEKLSGKSVALKCIPKINVYQPELQIQLLRETEIQFRCKHSHLCELHGWFQDSHNIYMVLEYCSMGSLFRYSCANQTFEGSEESLLQLGNIFLHETTCYCHRLSSLAEYHS